jgi:hypothetical protein
MAKAVLLEEFHIRVLAPADMNDPDREKRRRVLVSRRFRRRLQRVLRNAFAFQPELNDLVVRLGW